MHIQHISPASAFFVHGLMPDGSLSQLGSTSIGIQTKAGVVLAVEKRLTSPLLIPSR
jgi:20S proteasome alpha/beta subunit